MDTHPAPALPAFSLLNLVNRKVAPFDAPYWLASVDGTALNPPMLVEGVNAISTEFVGDGIFLSLWPAKRRAHVMHGLLVDPQAMLTFTFHAPDPA